MTLPLREAREMFEKDYLIAQINRFGGNISRTAEFVGMREGIEPGRGFRDIPDALREKLKRKKA